MNEIDEEEEMNRFILEQLINFTGGILVETSLLLALNRSLSFQGFVVNDEIQQMDYVRASYFVVISFSTIGYGDVYPIHRVSKAFANY